MAKIYKGVAANGESRLFLFVVKFEGSEQRFCYIWITFPPFIKAPLLEQVSNHPFLQNNLNKLIVRRP